MARIKPRLFILPIIAITLIIALITRHPELKYIASPPIRRISDQYDTVFNTGCLNPELEAQRPRANAAFVILTRNNELEGVIRSIKSVERHFNRWFHYPYIFLNDHEFNSTFRNTVQNYTSSRVSFGRIRSEHWEFPDWVDPEDAKDAIFAQGESPQKIMYGGKPSYHHMCRFFSGYFYKHQLLKGLDWYWRLEPGTRYFCDITYDPFRYMEQHNKTYGFTIAIKEFAATVPNLFRYASAYKRHNHLPSKGLWEMFVDRVPSQTPFNATTQAEFDAMEGETYNLCHFWSNFEIAKLDWFRSEEYQSFFDNLDRSGGFWNERWGDAPVHSLAAGALLGPRDIHYFRDIGYRHTTIQHCPANAPGLQLPRIPYYENTTLDAKERKKEDDSWAHLDPERENGVGCRCKCDTDIKEIEEKREWETCMPQWINVAGGYVT